MAPSPVRSFLAILAMLILFGPTVPLAEASSEGVEDALARPLHLHSETAEPHIEIGLAYKDPAARGLAGLLDVTLTPRGSQAFEVGLLIDAPPGVILTSLLPTDFGTLAENQTALARYLVTSRDVGVHALEFRALSNNGMFGERQAWLNVTTLASATLMVDYRTDEPLVGGERASTQAPKGGDALDVTPEEPGLSDRPWPALIDPDADLPPATHAVAAMGAAGGDPAEAGAGSTFTARLCWNFEDPERNIGEEWMRARWVNYRVMASIAGPDRELAQGLTGKDGCATVGGLPRTVDGSPTKAYFALRSCNAAACVVGMDHPDGYVWQTGWMTLSSGQDMMDWGDRVPSTHLYAGRIYARAMNGWSWYVNVGLTPKSILETAEIRAPSQPYGGGTYMAWSTEIYIEVNGDADVNEETVLHEYSHFWHFTLADWFPGDAGGQHWLCDAWQRKGLAWTEGFASYAAVRVNYDLGRLGVPGSSGDAAYKVYGLEANACGNDVGNGNVANSESEFRVARTLWDLTDTASDGYDTSPAASIPELLKVVRTCGGWDLRDILHSSECGWKQAGQPVCVFLRAAHQNLYDANKPPTPSFPGFTADTYVHDTILVAASVTDHDGGTGNCPLSTRLVATPSLVCDDAFLIDVAVGSSPAGYWNTEQVMDKPYYICATASDGLESTTLRSDARYLVDNTGPRIELLLQLQSWYNAPPSIPSQCVDDGVGYENVYGNRRIRINNGTWDAQDSFASVTVEGRHWAEIECYDVFGNRGVRGFPLNYDHTDPVITYTTSPGPFDRDRVTVTMTCTDLLSGCGHFYYSYGGVTADYTGPFELTTLATVSMGAVDRASNHDNIYPLLGVERDPPVVSIENSSHTEAISLPGWHWSEPTIAIPCSDEISGVGGITYKLNGLGNYTYFRPFELALQGAINITATCRDEARNTANVSKIVKVDTLPPSTNTTLQGTLGNAGWYRSNVTLTVGCSDDGSGIGRVDHRLDNGTWVILSTTNPVASLGYDGAKWLESRCVDRVGADVSVAQRLAIDRAAPSTTVSFDAASPAGRAVNVTFGCADQLLASGCANTTYRVDNGTWRTGAHTSVTAEGTHVVEAYSTDVAGNVGLVASRTIVIDLTLPALNVTFNGTLGSNGWYTSAVLMTAACSDALSGVAAREYRLSNGNWTAFTTNVSFGVSGARSLDVRCVDAAGNAAQQSFVLRIDRVAPSTSLTPATTSWTNAANVTVDVSCADFGSGCNHTAYRVDGGEWLQVQGSIVVSAEGEHLVEARSTDHAGLLGTTGSTTVRIDRTLPSPTLTLSPAPPASGWYLGRVNATASCSDGASGVARIETGWIDQPLTLYNGTVVLSREGAHEWVVSCTDAVGNTARATSIVRIDFTSPTTTLSAPAVWQRANVSVGVTCSDAGSGCATRKARLDGGAWQTLGVSGSYLVTTDGDHVVEAMSIDAAGRESPIVSVPVRIDRVAPSVGVGLGSAVPSSGWFRATVNATATCTDGLSGVARLLVGYRDTTFDEYVGPVTLDREGSHEWLAACTDAAGNTAVASQEVKIDLAAPTVSFRAATVGTDFRFNWTVSDSVSGLTGNIVVEEQGARVPVTVCSQAASGATRTGSCTLSGVYEERCYRLRATDVSGWTTTTAYQCIQLYHE